MLQFPPMPGNYSTDLFVYWPVSMLSTRIFWLIGLLFTAHYTSSLFLSGHLRVHMSHLPCTQKHVIDVLANQVRSTDKHVDAYHLLAEEKKIVFHCFPARLT